MNGFYSINSIRKKQKGEVVGGDVSDPLGRSWVDRAKTTARVHQQNFTENPEWKIADTAKYLNRSIGRVSEDLMLCHYMKTHPRVELFRTAQEALDYCRKIKADQKRMIV